jgi:sec-independent protein translocase protein TatA
MGELFTPTHLLIVAAVALLLFGPRKLPELGKGLGEGLRGFKDAIKGSDAKPADTTPMKSDAHTVTPQPAAQAAPPSTQSEVK